MSATNPYAPPKAHVNDVPQATPDAEVIRREHIQHETSVRSVGLLYYLGGGLLCIGSVGLIGTYASTAQDPFLVILGAIYLALGVLSLFVARGLRRLHPWARIATLVLSGIGLLAFPVGTLINGYVLYLLLATKGKRIFDDDYADIVAATPHVKYRTSVAAWVGLGILVLLIAGGVAILAFRG